MKIAKRLEGHYEAHDVLGAPPVHLAEGHHVVVECKCGKRLSYKKTTLLETVVRCECGKDHSASLREELVLEVLRDDKEVLHPSRYRRAPESEALPV